MALGESTDVTASLSGTPARPDEDWYLLFGDRPRAVDVSVSGIPGRRSSSRPTTRPARGWRR
jgi:hypothetical protein